MNDNFHSNPLPEFEGVPHVNMTVEDKANLDLVALHHLPNDALSGFAPISIEGDGNCLPRIVSYILQKDQANHKEIHVRIVYEAVQNMAKYLDNDYVSTGTHHFYSSAQIKKQRPCHFVSLLKVVRKDIHKMYMYVNFYFKQILMLSFTFCICSCVKLPAVTETVNKVTAKSHSEDRFVKIVDDENVEKEVHGI